MRVICINGVKAGDRALFNNYSAPKSDCIYEREIYTVAGIGEYNNIIFYRLLERQHMYQANRFIPLSEIDEMEYVRIELKQHKN